MGIVGGPGGGAGFQLFTQSNGSSGVYADAAARDVYFGANPSELARLDANEFLVIKLLDDGGGNVAYQQRSGGNWLDVTSLVQGDTGPAGATGNSFFFKSIAERDTFFGTSPNEGLLENGLPINVNIGDDTVSVFVWGGGTSPPSYDSTLWRLSALEVSSGTLYLGESGVNISSGSEVMNFISAAGVSHYLHGVSYDDTGSNSPAFWRFPALSQTVLANVSDTTLSDPQTLSITNTVNIAVKEYTLIPAASGELRVQTWLGTDETGPSIVDTYITVDPGDVGNQTVFEAPNNIFILTGQDTYTKFSGLQLKGGLQTSGPFIGQTVPFATLSGWIADQDYFITTDTDTSNDTGIAFFDGTDNEVTSEPRFTYTKDSDDRFLNVDMVVAFDGEVGLRIRNELGVNKTILTYEGNNEETYFNTYGSGGLITTIDGGDCVFQMSSVAANFKINGTASPDTNDVFSLVSGGSNGGSSNFLVGSRNPEGNANKAFGHFYIRTDGVNTGLYAKKSAGVSTTDWYPFPTAPQATVANAIPTFANTTGTALNTVNTALLTSDANDTTLTIDAVSASGDSVIELRDNANNAHLTLLYDGVTDIPVISSSLGVVRFQSSPAWPFSNYVDAVSPGATAITGYRIVNTSLATKLLIEYNEGTDICEISSSTANDLLFDSNAGFTFTGDTLKIDTSNTNLVEVLDLIASGTGGGTSKFYLSSVTPEGAITADGGAICIRDSGTTSDIYLKRTDGGNTGWVDLLHSGSGISGPGTTVNNTFVPWNSTDGTTVGAQSQFIYALDGGTGFLLAAKPQTAAGSVSFNLRNVSDASQFTLSYSNSTDVCTINMDTHLIMTTTPGASGETGIRVISPGVTGDAKIALENSSSSETFAIRYLETSDIVQVLTNKNVIFSNSIASGKFTFSHGVTGQTLFETTGTNTNAPISLKTTGANGATSNLFISDETPQGNITAVNVGDLCVRADGVDGDDSLLYIAADTTSADWYYFPKIFEGADQILTVPSGSGSGSASVILANSSGTAKGTFAFDQTLDQVSLDIDAVSLDISSTGLLTMESGSDVVRLRRDEASTSGPAIQFENDTVASRMFLLDVNPQGVTVASPADFAILEDSADSGMFIHEGFQGSNDDWHKVITSPSDGMIGTVYGGLGQFQNYLEYSEDIDNAAWTKEVAVTVTPNNIVSPNGETTTDTVAWSASSLGLSQVVPLAATTTYTLTFWGVNTLGNPILTFDLDSTGVNITLDSTLRKYSIQITTGAGPTHTFRVSKPVASGTFGLFGFNLSLGNAELPYAHTADTAITTKTYGGIINGPLRFGSVVEPLQLDNLKISTATTNPQNILSGNVGDLIIVADASEPDDSRIYIHGDGTDTDDDWWFMPTVYAGVSENLTLNSNTPSANASLSLKSFAASQQVTLQYDDNTGNALLEMAAPNGAEINSPLSFLLIHADDDEIRLRRGDTGVTGEILNIQNSTTNFGIWADTQTPIGNATGSPGDLHVEVNGVDSALSIHKGASSNNTDWKEVLTIDERTLVYSVDVDGIDQTEFILVGEYRVVDTGETGDYATDYPCNNQHTSIEVNSLTGSGVVTFTGVSMSESSGIPTATTETVTVDAVGKYQTDKKWLEITNIDIPAGITAINYDVEVLGYLDMQNSDFEVTGIRVDGLSSGNDSDFSLGIIKVQDDGSKKCSLVDIEQYGYDAKDDLIVDDLRTGGDDRSYTATTSIWANGTNACLKVSDYSTYFTSDENILESSSKHEGIIIHFNGTAGGSLKNVSTLNLHLTIKMN